MRYTVIFLGLLIFTGCQREVMPLHAPRTYLDQTRAFLQWFRSQGPKQGSFILLDSVTSEIIEPDFSIYNSIEDSVDFTADERAQIAGEIKHPRITVWTNDWVPDARIIPKQEINEIFKDGGIEGGWNAFYNRYGESFSDYSMPIFLRDNTLCLFYSGNHCGGLCGYGALVLYRRDGNGWVVVRDFGSWVS